MKFLRITQYIYLIVAVLSIAKVIEIWNEDRTRAYFFVGFAVISLFMFFFRKRYAKKFEERKNQE